MLIAYRSTNTTVLIGAAASEWKHTVPAGDLSVVSKIVLVIAPKSTGRVRIDNVRLATVR